MSELTIGSDPSGAEVVIDGEVVGVTPLTIPVEISLQSFRAECLSGGSVSCSWDTLKTRLEDQTVSRLWWDITETERRSIAEMAIRNTMFYAIQFRRSGKPNCEGGEGEWYRPECVTNSIIRYQKFAQPMGGTDSCYWTQNIHDGTEECFVPDCTYGLPCHIVSCHGVKDPHSMCSIKVVQGIDSVDNWIIFQYSDFNIKLGDPQIPLGSTIDIRIPSSVVLCSGIIWDSTVATFVAPIDELQLFREECLSDGNVTCSWDLLKAKLEDQTVSKLWWLLEDNERRSITMVTIVNEIQYQINWKRKGLYNCEGGTGDLSRASCATNAMIRYSLFGHPMNEMDRCYYRRFEDHTEICFLPRYSYNLPCYMVSCVGISHLYNHTMCGIQVASEADKLSSWIIFQYADFDIQPGNWQMPTDSYVSMYVPDRLTPCGGIGQGHGVATFKLPPSELMAFRTECLDNGEVSCDWDTLKTRLEDQTVSRLWWDMTWAERRSVTIEATKNVMCFYITRFRRGKSDCEGGEGDWLQADCGSNTVIRGWKFGSESPDGYDAYWEHPVTKEEHCFVPDIAYNLPCHDATVSQEHFGHGIAAMQIGEDVTDIKNWVFFQYATYDLQPGDGTQFPTPSTLSIQEFGGPMIVEMSVE